MTLQDPLQYSYTRSALTDRLKKELAKVKLDFGECLKKIDKGKNSRLPNRYWYDYNSGLDFSINTKDPEDIKRKLYDDRKYYYHGHHYLKLGLFKREDIPYFWVDLSDLSNEIIYELKQLDPVDRKFVLRQAVGRILEDINFDIYHDSVSCCLDVRLR